MKIVFNSSMKLGIWGKEFSASKNLLQRVVDAYFILCEGGLDREEVGCMLDHIL